MCTGTPVRYEQSVRATSSHTLCCDVQLNILYVTYFLPRNAIGAEQHFIFF